MKETFTKWDPLDHLKTDGDFRLYLEACAEEDPGDAHLVRAALNDIGRARNFSALTRDIDDAIARHEARQVVQDLTAAT